jgi:hypothetical protein
MMINRRGMLKLLGLAPVAAPMMAEAAPIIDLRQQVERQRAPLKSSLTITNGVNELVVTSDRVGWFEVMLRGHKEMLLILGDFRIRREFSKTDTFRLRCFDKDHTGREIMIPFTYEFRSADHS